MECPGHRTTDGTTWQDISNNMAARRCPVKAPSGKAALCVTTPPPPPPQTVAEERGIATGVAADLQGLATEDGGQQGNAYNTPLASIACGGASPSFRNPFDGCRRR